MSGLSDTKGEDWEQLASGYEKMTYQTSKAPISKMLERAHALAPLSRATGVLDNGCGPGPIMTRIIEEYGSDVPGSCSLTCADFSEGMIKQVNLTKDKAPPASPWKRVQTKVQNAMDLVDVADDSMSHVFAGWVYFMTPEPQKCLSESRRVLRDDGVLSLSSWEDNQWMKIMGDVVKVRPDKQLPEVPAEWRSESGVGDELMKAGFRDIETHRVTVHMDFDNHEGFVEFLVTKLPHMVHLTSDMPDEENKTMKALMVETLKSMCPSAPGQLEGVSIVGLGRK
ncbi:hypothetical protein KC331_g14165 [Hortaea werneckii]|uniref:Methyltransferase type 11 domain-containing protein n=1 Tax=Hortaea werneckii TaxID=91943 RepID=A0A3M7CY68_HORWE|nr:hypothetical protein KC331_g14165 [Hortaea werneckii]KAI7706949.1 hypothetical protein KC353_g11941 [Hortaea werneckii]RMY56870.1 hypothetical protein D0865_03412 [Hortaea werneckii]